MKRCIGCPILGKPGRTRHLCGAYFIHLINEKRKEDRFKRVKQRSEREREYIDDEHSVLEEVCDKALTGHKSRYNWDTGYDLKEAFIVRSSSLKSYICTLTK